MVLNHLNLTVPDAAETAAFLEKYFGMHTMPGVEQKKTFAMVMDDQGMVLTLIRAGQKGGEVVYPPTFHIGFGQPNAEAVNAVHARLIADGYEAPAPSEQHGAWTFYLKAPGGFEIEVLSALSE